MLTGHGPSPACLDAALCRAVEWLLCPDACADGIQPAAPYLVSLPLTVKHPPTPPPLQLMDQGTLAGAVHAGRLLKPAELGAASERAVEWVSGGAEGRGHSQRAVTAHWLPASLEGMGCSGQQGVRAPPPVCAAASGSTAHPPPAFPHTYTPTWQRAVLMRARDAAAGLSYLHGRGVVHADVKVGATRVAGGPRWGWSKQPGQCHHLCRVWK